MRRTTVRLVVDRASVKITWFANLVVVGMVSVAWNSSFVRVRAWQTSRTASAFPFSYLQRNENLFHGPAFTRLRHHFATDTNVSGDSDDINQSASPPAPSLQMENLYTEWTLDQDRLLWKHHEDSTTAELAALLGRGLRGIENRLAKLQDVDSPAYERLFASQQRQQPPPNESDAMEKKKERLIPAGEVLRRIQWDYTLSSSDFSILHYDRVEDSIMESPLDAPNESIQGGSTLLVDALPEHRIVAIKYKEQVVWDREKRLDLFFSNDGIQYLIANYDEWKRKKDAHREWMRLRQAHAADIARGILGPERYDKFLSTSTTLKKRLENPPTGFSVKKETEEFVQTSINLFRQAHQQRTPMEVVDRSIDLEAVECLSELVAVSDNEDYRSIALEELSIVLCRLEGKPSIFPSSTSRIDNRQLPEISEDDITETFVRGSGAGGQKVNKTSNKVVLLHNPTNLRVECQETRSLQQNRKIARKRLRIKLDEFLNGKQSRTNLLAEKASTKKAKAKARSRARNRKKAAMKEDPSS